MGLSFHQRSWWARGTRNRTNLRLTGKWKRICGLSKGTFSQTWASERVSSTDQGSEPYCSGTWWTNRAWISLLVAFWFDIAECTVEKNLTVRSRALLFLQSCIDLLRRSNGFLLRMVSFWERWGERFSIISFLFSFVFFFFFFFFFFPFFFFFLFSTFSNSNLVKPRSRVPQNWQGSEKWAPYNPVFYEKLKIFFLFLAFWFFCDCSHELNFALFSADS